MHSARFASLVLALAVFATAFALAFAPAAHAQERERIGLLYKLFGSRETPRQAESAPPAPAKAKPRKKRAKPAPVAGAEQQAAPPVAATAAKQPDARTVMVVGDFLASGLAEGLSTAFTQNPNIKIADRSNGSSGLVRLDHYDWAEQINQLITAERPVAVVVMMGANDRQQMQVDGTRETVRSDNWNRQYAERANQLAKAVAARKIPLLWVGMPPFKSSRMMQDMLAFNDVYRAAATAAGGEFIDIWDGFVDENGDYVANGPDLNGQPARLRANDGINLARPGKRKVAFYAEKPLSRILGEGLVGSDMATSETLRPAYRMFGPFGPDENLPPAELDIVVDRNEIGLVDPARPIAIRTPALDGGAELLGAVSAPRMEAQTLAEKLIIEGFASAPPAGRADQFAMPMLASAAGASRQLHLDRTLNKAPVLSELLPAALDRAAVRTVLSDQLTRPPLPMPPRPAPEIGEDRIGEISPLQAAPDIAAPAAPATSPATQARAVVPDAEIQPNGDRSPVRPAPLAPFKRPTSIGPEPNRAPTAVPQPALIEPPAQSEVPMVSADDPSVEQPARPALPDTAPARTPAPSFLADMPTADGAPARAAPDEAVSVPVAALPEPKDVPPKPAVVKATPPLSVPSVAAASVSGLDSQAAKPVPMDAVLDMGHDASAKSAPSGLDSVASPAPYRSAPTVLPVEVDADDLAATDSAAADVPEKSVPVTAATVETDAPVRAAPTSAPDPNEAVSTPLAAPVTSPAIAVLPAQATPAAPTAPSELVDEAANEAQSRAKATPGADAQMEPQAPAASTPPAPSAPTILQDNAQTPRPTMRDRRAETPYLRGQDVSVIVLSPPDREAASATMRQ